MLKVFRKAALLVFFSIGSLFAVSPDQTFTERALSENRYFIEFINIGVSNFGTQKNIDDLKEANQHNFNANLWYLQSNYSAAFKEIRRSQEILKDLYYDLLVNRYLEDARTLLDMSAPQIVQSKDKKAEMFLRLGYRDLEAARQYGTMGYNYNRFLFSNKVHYYIDAVKRARRAKRFAFLAIIESNTPYEEKDDYRLQTIDEALRQVEREQVSDFERVRNLLTNQLNRRLYEDTFHFFEHHYDNYGYIAEGKTNVVKEGTKDLTTSDVSGTLPPSSSAQPDDNTSTETTTTGGNP